MSRPFSWVAVTTAMASILASSAAHAGVTFNWSTVVNNNDLFPGDSRNFNSYNQPSVNNNGLVVFRARTQGGGGQPGTGVLTRDMASPGNPIVPFAVRGGLVPQPNNTAATFNEFPSTPRIDARSSMIATRGQSNPVLEYQTGIDPATGEPITTRGGTSGIYANPRGSFITGMSGLGNVNNDVFPSNPNLSYFQVPHTMPGTKFDQFPGAPSATNGNTLVFKGNWTEGSTGMTGVYFRNLMTNRGKSPVQLIADSKTEIPGFSGTTFGSTAPPSAIGTRAVFLGVDNEAAPTKGGIYMAGLNYAKAPDTPSVLSTIASIGQAVAGKANAFYTQLGEALSFDGRRVAYWGAWGNKDSSGNIVTPMRAVNVSCGSIENANVSSFCLAQDDGSTPGSGTAGDGIYTFDVPVDQGFFITDVQTLQTRLVAETGNTFQDFLFWNFSGKVPGSQDEADGELARWRSASFIADDGWSAAFKASLQSGGNGLYQFSQSGLSTIAELGMDGGLLDPAAQGLPISSLGLERDGYRNGWLTINAAMTDGVNSMAGIYITRTRPIRSLAASMAGVDIARAVPEPSSWAMLIAGFGLTGALLRRRRKPVFA